jgi:hypothetical protein
MDNSATNTSAKNISNVLSNACPTWALRWTIRLIGSLAAQYAAGDSIQFLKQFRIARFRGRDQSVVESAVGTDWAQFVLARKIAGKARDQRFRRATAWLQFCCRKRTCCSTHFT